MVTDKVYQKPIMQEFSLIRSELQDLFHQLRRFYSVRRSKLLRYFHSLSIQSNEVVVNENKDIDRYPTNPDVIDSRDLLILEYFQTGLHL